MNEGPETPRRGGVTVGRVAARLRAARLLWAAILSSNLFVLAVIALGARALHPDPAVRLYPPIFGALAAAIAVVAVALPARGFAVALRAMKVRVEEDAGEGLGGFRQAALVRRRVADPEQTLVDALTRFQTALVLGMALAEAISLLGFVLAFFGLPVAQWVGFFVVGGGLMLSKFPRVATVVRGIERATGASLTL